jgi:DNA-binding transcriptional MerR regulator
METISPAEAVERTGLSLDTLRYYEREGLVGPIIRNGGRRRYTDHDIDWIGMVTCLRDAGLGIDDLRRFTTLLRSDASPSERVAFLEHRRDQLRERLRTTERALAVLDDKISYFGPGGPGASEPLS